MAISIPERLESEMRFRAEEQGITVEAYLESLVRADEQATKELGRLAEEGLASGDAFEPATDYWQNKHEMLDRQLKAR